MRRLSFRALGGLGLLLGFPGLGEAQLPARPPIRRAEPATPSLQAELLQQQAEKLRMKAYDLRVKADDLRDENKDGQADELDGRVESLFEQARGLEERARQIQLSGGQHPERVIIPDL